MTSIIPTIYKDEFGSVSTQIINDSDTLTIVIDGVTFTSRNFDNFSPIDDSQIPARFTLNTFNELTNCSLLCEIPIIMWKGADVPATLIVDIWLDDTGMVYNTYSTFSLAFDNSIIEIGTVQHFESAFYILMHKLPQGIYPKCCYTCLYSDYGVAGSSIFGSMSCFKNIKEQYLAVQNKGEYMDIAFQYDRATQETYLCSEFEFRNRDVGYRNWW